MNSIGKIIKEIIIPQWKCNIRLNPAFLVLDDAHIQGFLLGTDYQRIYGIDIYNSKNRHITIGSNKEKIFSLDTNQVSTCKIKGHDLELYLDVERPYPPMPRRPPYPESLEARKEIEKNINELLDMAGIRKIGYNEIKEITTPVLITWHDDKSRLCGDFRALNNYKKADSYPIPRINWLKPNT
ncbi:hypothetical protein O181_015140 [Austropuccinia psidii MF-1]|uniref:Uncharacterized protein n=1 Tax=Austropuccinia psidii MF-1 TaxID=1389203 RepID=A0A9Q3C3A7_9BASI|nr:hypothetical protein [Austropuccinia psidii MF-1]